MTRHPVPAASFADAFERTRLRRLAIAAAACRQSGQDFLASQRAVLDLPGRGRVWLELRLVPDRLILPPAAFEAYLAVAAQEPPEAFEDFGALLFDDLKNELVPRWIQLVAGAALATGSGLVADQILLFEDRQPRWDNPGLLARVPGLPPISQPATNPAAVTPPAAASR